MNGSTHNGRKKQRDTNEMEIEVIELEIGNEIETEIDPLQFDGRVKNFINEMIMMVITETPYEQNQNETCRRRQH